MESILGLISVPSHPPAVMLRVLLCRLVGSLCGGCGCASGVVWKGVWRSLQDRALSLSVICVLWMFGTSRTVVKSAIAHAFSSYLHVRCVGRWMGSCNLYYGWTDLAYTCDCGW